MDRQKKYWPLLLLVLALGFIAGLFLAPSLSFTSRKETQADSKTPIQLKDESDIHELMKHMSHVFEEVASTVSLSVVSIFAEQTVQTPQTYGLPDEAYREFFGEDFFRRFFGAPPKKEENRTVRSMGSGVIVTKDGYILTNNHVIANAERLSVVTGDKQAYEAEVIGADPPTDVAIIKIKAKNLPAAILSDSDKVKVGQWVIAVGNPFRLMHTVTTGIISAKGRSSVGLAAYEDFFQTDASINPGNSGGALADLNGEIIGINTAITSPSGGNIGIGFAIPINMAKQVMDELISNGKVTRGYIGLIPQDIDKNIAAALNTKEGEGVLIREVVRNGPADRSGIKPGDIIMQFNKSKVINSTQFRNLVAKIKPEATIKIVLFRNSQKMEVTVILEERPNE